MWFRVGGAIVDGNFDLPKTGDICLRDTSSGRSLLGLLEKHVDLGCGTGTLLNLRFHCFHFHGCLCDVIAEITDFIDIVASSFPSLSAFAGSDSSLLLGELFLFDSKDVFFFFSHWFFERRL